MNKRIVAKLVVLLISFGCCFYFIQSKSIALHPYMGVVNGNLLEEGLQCGEFVGVIIDIVYCSQDVLKETENDTEGKRLEELKTKLIEPKKSFLKLMYCYKGLMQPLLRKALEDEPGMKLSKSLLDSFFKQPKLDEGFFNRSIDSRDKLIYTCKELYLFVLQLAENLSDEVVGEFIKFLKQKQKVELSSEDRAAYGNYVRWLVKRKNKRSVGPGQSRDFETSIES